MARCDEYRGTESFCAGSGIKMKGGPGNIDAGRKPAQQCEIVMLEPMLHQDNLVVRKMEEVLNSAVPAAIVYSYMHKNGLCKDEVCRSNMGNALCDIAGLHHLGETRMTFCE